MCKSVAQASKKTMHTFQLESSNVFNQLVELSGRLSQPEKLRLARLLKKEAKVVSRETIETHFASESMLAKDWLTESEDTAWQNL